MQAPPMRGVLRGGREAVGTPCLEISAHVKEHSGGNIFHSSTLSRTSVIAIPDTRGNRQSTQVNATQHFLLMFEELEMEARHLCGKGARRMDCNR